MMELLKAEPVTFKPVEETCDWCAEGDHKNWISLEKYRRDCSPTLLEGGVPMLLAQWSDKWYVPCPRCNPDGDKADPYCKLKLEREL